MSSDFDPLGLLDGATVKGVKAWGDISAQNGTAGNWKKPSTQALAVAGLQLSESDSVTYTIDGGMDAVNSILASIPAEPHTGALGCEVSFSQDSAPVGSVTVRVARLVLAPHGETQEDEVDYGSDGSGGTDTEIWSTQKVKKTTKDEYRLEWDARTNWPPFSKYGQQVMPATQVAAYKLLVEGNKPGDVFVIGGVPATLKQQGADYDYAYFELLRHDGKCLVWRHIVAESWVISSKAHAQKYDPGEKGQSQTLPDGTVEHTVCRANNDGPDKDHPRSWTVTRTRTTSERYNGQTVPHGKVLVDASKIPEDND